jgi:sialic acid synthase SpsE
LRVETERAWQAMGGVRFGGSKAEAQSMLHRRSLYIVKDLQPGDVLSRDNVRAIRPGLGLPPKHLDLVLGMQVQRATKRGTPLDWALLR